MQAEQPGGSHGPRASWYERHCFHPLMDRVLDGEAVRAERRRTLAPARGRALEVGFGTGLNVPHLPEAVTSLVGLTRDPRLGAAAERRIAARGLPFEHVPGDAHALPFPDDDEANGFDTVVCTLVLCSLRDPVRAVAEMLRVLRPGGRLVVFEHVRAEGGLERLAQRVLQPVQRAVACGCGSCWAGSSCAAGRPTAP